PVKMEFNYASSYGATSPEAYERLILDVMAGDATLFMRRDHVETAWKWVMPILETWASERVLNLPEYQCGTWGPIEADRLIQSDWRQWRTRGATPLSPTSSARSSSARPSSASCTACWSSRPMWAAWRCGASTCRTSLSTATAWRRRWRSRSRCRTSL